MAFFACGILLTGARRLSGADGSSGASTAGMKPIFGPMPEPFWANSGLVTFGFQFGYGLENHIPHDVSHINMLIAQPQIGIVAWQSYRSRLPFNRVEIISEGILGGAPRPGGHLFGDTVLFRFGFKPVGHTVPFIDAGSGPLHTTLDKSAREVTGQTQFLSQCGVGIQYFYKPQHAIVVEYRYFHMSNAGLQLPNPGFNGSMVTIGFRWLRRPRPLNVASSHNSLHFLHIW